MNETIQIILSVIYLVAVLVCFTILAITFNNYWIILLALCFMHININVNDKRNGGAEDD